METVRSGGDGRAQKRSDIQGIRGLAIISVLAFHFCPRYFPAGFLGVDIFFVLSGYLMSNILAKEEQITLSVLSVFYRRRFKRIVPLFALTLTLLFVILPFIFFTKELKRFLLDVPWSAAFAMNISSFMGKFSYWEEILDCNVLTHTWSLGVEVQHYLLAPFIISLRRFPGGLAAFLVLATGSLICQLLAEETFAFNALPSRIWQFLAGSLAFEMQSLPDYKSKVGDSKEIEVVISSKLDIDKATFEELQGAAAKKQSRLNYYAILLLMSICLMPSNYFFCISIIRILAVSITAILLFLGSHSQLDVWPTSNILMVYMGDISYVTYLVHWPVIVIWKSYFDEPQLDAKGVLCCLFLTLVAAVALHHSAEKCFIESSTRVAISFVTIVYALMLSAFLLGIPQATVNDREFSVARSKAVEWNLAESLHNTNVAGPFPECQKDVEGALLAGGNVGDLPYQCAVKNTSSSSNFTMLILGNSVAVRASRVIYAILKRRTKTFRVFATSGCQPLEHRGICQTFFAATLKLAKNMRPSAILLSYDEDRTMNLDINDVYADKYAMELNNYLSSLSKTTEYLIVDDLYPITGKEIGVAYSLYKRLIRNQHIDGFRRDYREFQNTNANYFCRMNAAVRGIPNLIRNNLSRALCAEEVNVCWWYNRRNNHSYFSDRTHLSPEGLALIKPTYEQIFSTILTNV